MGLLGSTLGRALAGGAKSGSDILNKYIDQDLALNRAQVLADIQRNSNVQQSKDIDDYQNSPTRRAGLRDQTSLDSIAAARATQQAKLEELTNDPLTAAGVARDNYVTTATAPAKAEATGLITRATAVNTAHNVGAGSQVIIGEGKNTTPTAAELNDRLIRDGLKDKSKEERNRYFEAEAKTLAEQMKEKQGAIDKFLAENPQAMTTPKPAEKGWFRETPAEKSPAYDNYQRLLRDRSALAKKNDDLMVEWRAERSGGGQATRGGGDSLNLFPAPKGGSPKAGESASPPNRMSGTPAEESTKTIKALETELQSIKPTNVSQIERRKIIQSEIDDERARLAAAPTTTTPPAKPADPKPDDSIADRAMSGQTKKATPASYVPPEGSYARKVQDERAKKLAEQDAQDAAKATEDRKGQLTKTQVRAEFDADVKNLSRGDLWRKYGYKERALLLPEQLTMLLKGR